jgi:class 3 adenylate cyclase
MSTNNKKKRALQQDPILRLQNQANTLRILVFLVAVMLLTAGIAQKVYPHIYLLMVAVLLAYPLIAQTIGIYRRHRQRDEHQASRVLMQTDALVMGFAIASLHFSMIPSLVLLIIAHANAASYGGFKPWLLNVFLTFLGAILGTFIFTGNIIHPGDASILMQCLSLLGLAVFVAAASFFSHQQSRFLRASHLRLVQQQQQAVELSRKLAKYIPPQVWGSLFSGKRDAKLETRRKRLTVFFSDIKDFSRISEELPLKTLTSMLNSYLSEMTHIAEQHGGTVDKFIGDAVMVFFGDPSSRGAQEDAFQCVSMAIAMQKRMNLLRQRWRKEKINQNMEIRIGINTGYCTVGNFGTQTRLDYTILGTDVNLASRLESAARPGHILISDATFELVKDRIQATSIGEINVKGFERPISVHEVIDLKHQAGSRKNVLTASTQGFNLYLELPAIRNFDRQKILVSLASAARDLRSKPNLTVEHEETGFSLILERAQLRENDLPRVGELLKKAAQALQEYRSY